MNDDKDVVITGMGIVSPLGNSLSEFWNNCKSGKKVIKRIKRFDKFNFKCKVAATVENFHYKKLSYDYDPHILYGFSATEQALCHAGLDITPENNNKVGVSIATAIAGTAYMENAYVKMMQPEQEGEENITPANLMINSHFSTCASEIARKYGIYGPVYALSTGCTAGLDALGAAIDLIKSGKCEVVIAGATEAPLTPIAFAAFDIIGAMTSKDNDRPEKASRPYDKTRSGFVLGEGCGIFILESKKHAEDRGANILATIAGMSSTCNAYHMTNLDSEGDDLHRAMKLALERSDTLPEEIDYVNAHGSSTQQNDVNETNAIKKTFGPHAYELAISSVKSIAGHALSAANMIESVAAVMSIIHQETTPSLNIDMPDENCDLNYVKNEKMKINTVLKNASGFSGIHSAIILKSAGGA